MAEARNVSLTDHVDFDDVREVFTVQEFERQVFGLMSSQGFYGRRLTEYRILIKTRNEIYAKLEAATLQIPNTADICWDTKFNKKLKQSTKGKPNPESPVHKVECDLYFMVQSWETEEFGQPLLLSTVLNALISSDPRDVQYLNARDRYHYQQENSVKNFIETFELSVGDYVWIEIAITAFSLRNKLFQVERAHLFCLAEQLLELEPKVIIICLNGNREQFLMAVNNVMELFDGGQLNRWSILNSDIPVLAIFTPFRNTYATLETLNQSIGTLSKDVNTLNNKFSNDIKTLNDKFSMVDKDVKSLSNKVETLSHDLETLSNDFATLSNDFATLSNNVNEKFTKVETDLETLSNKMNDNFATIMRALEQRNNHCCLIL